ncbi:hypothetical protein M407DRAFT_161713 [Tulasnella calospora MUT 4182]|uniref:Uncharacterized protein n=1 Tax=Tulasnella calospora MUT 4182 TaxID=1051891 RepID=A0A0C3K9Z3_9AGAM|nr:hypothetical protein M407DRAFT_161713 [Tulasnella calospora MUT 4182]
MQDWCINMEDAQPDSVLSQRFFLRFAWTSQLLSPTVTLGTSDAQFLTRNTLTYPSVRSYQPRPVGFHDVFLPCHSQCKPWYSKHVPSSSNWRFGHRKRWYRLPNVLGAP